MRIKKIELDGVGPFVNATFEIPEPENPDAGELVLFEGPNGSGKTTVLKTIILSMDSTHSPGPWLRDNGRYSVEVEHRAVDLDGVPQYWRKRVSRGSAFRFYNPPMILYYDSHLNTPELKVSRADLSVHPFNTVPFRRRGLAPYAQYSDRVGQWLYFMLQRKRAFQEIFDNGPDERKAGARGTVAYIETLFGELERALSSFVEQPVKIVIEESSEKPARVAFRFAGVEIPIELIGEGLRSGIAWLLDLVMQVHVALLVDALQDEPTNEDPNHQDFVLVLDEVDQSMHPRRQMKIIPLLRGLFPKARIYASTHSPFVVASAATGWVFRIRPNGVLGSVEGPVACEPLRPGQTLEWVVREIFDAPDTFVDAKTRELLARHQQLLDELRQGHDEQWEAFLDCRAELASFESEVVGAVTAMREGPLRAQIRERAQKRAAAARPEAPA